MTNLTYATAGEQSAAMAAGEVSSVELTGAAIARLERIDGEIGAVCVPDLDRALAAAPWPTSPGAMVIAVRCWGYR